MFNTSSLYIHAKNWSYSNIYIYIYIYADTYTEGAKKMYTHFKRYLCKMCIHFFGTLCISTYLIKG